MGQLAKAASNAAIQQGEKPRTLADVIKGQMPKIMAVAPKHLSEERLFQLTISTINREPKLGECDAASILGAVMKCSALGLEPSAVDGLGRAYILPFYNSKTKRTEATFLLGYQGMMELVRRSGEVKSYSAHAVYEGDVFEYEFGLNETLRHIPQAVDMSQEKLTHVYFVAHFNNGGHHIEVMTRAQVDAIKARSKSGSFGPWKTDYEAMAIKTVIRRAFKSLPVAVETKQATADEEREEYGLNTAHPFMADEPEPIQAEVVEPQRVAVCQSCGASFEAAPDATAEDFASMSCCDAPQYVIEER